eukprot:3837037-Rhodomonas_salina.1
MTLREMEAQLLRDRTFHQLSALFNQWQNGRAESKIQTISTRARAMLLHANVPARFWDYAV